MSLPENRKTSRQTTARASRIPHSGGISLNTSPLHRRRKRQYKRGALLDPDETARRVLIVCKQLGVLLQEETSFSCARAQFASYNGLLDTLHACFSIDPSFSGAIKHLEPFRELTPQMTLQMKSDGKLLLGTARRFIGLYLSTEDSV